MNVGSVDTTAADGSGTDGYALAVRGRRGRAGAGVGGSAALDASLVSIFSCDVELLCNGGFSPLEGFQRQDVQAAFERYCAAQTSVQG